jgi:hypothetical protein
MIFRILCFLFFSVPAISQSPATRKIWYTTTGGDAGIFSLASVEMDGREVRPILRFSPVFNFGSNLNWDYADFGGLYLGWNVRNIGMITRDSINQEDKFKRRVYMLGLPVGLKFGDMKRDRFVYFGGEIGYPFHYKEKFFADGDRDRKIRKREWFSERVETFTSAVFAGIHFNERFSIKAQYFLNNFFNKDYVTTDEQGNTIRPYANYSANLFFVTFNYDFSVKRIWERKKEPSRKTGEL